MHPFAVILGIVFGSLVAIAFGLGVVAFVFWLLQDDYQRLTSEMPLLLQSTGIFTVLAALAGGGLFGTLQKRPWRYAVLGGLWLGLGLVAWSYWPA